MKHYGNYLRWLYRGGHPNRFARLQRSRSAGPGVRHGRVDRDLAGVGAEVQRRLMTPPMVHSEVRDRTIGSQVVALAGMPVAVREREVGACDLESST
jgi:hypothetical protein